MELGTFWMQSGLRPEGLDLRNEANGIKDPQPAGGGLECSSVLRQSGGMRLLADLDLSLKEGCTYDAIE